ncbi:MAG: hypothetical protein RSB59_00665 [Clostridia bacterium]
MAVTTPNNFNTNFATNEIGTELFHYDETTKKVHYIAPIVEGADFTRDVEKIDTPELDIDYVPSMSGKATMPTAEYMFNYDVNRYKAVTTCVKANNRGTYIEAWSDGSGMVFTGDGSVGRTKGNPPQISAKINMGFMLWIENLLSLTAEEVAKLQGVFTGAVLTALKPLPFDVASIPDGRISHIKKNFPTV